MNNEHATLPPKLLAIAIGLLPVAVPLPVLADAAEGAALFQRQCSTCHRAGPQSLHTPAELVPGVLQGGGIRKHRFQLTDTQLRDLEAYLTEVKAHAR